MKLRAYLDEKDESPSVFAAGLSISTQALYRYMSGERVPRRDVMARITAATNGAVQPNDFFLEPQQSPTAPHAEAAA
jgi:hypothetical protein